MTQDWLKNLKADDYVIISSRRGKRLTRVQKITPTGRVIVDNIQFIGGANRSNKWDIMTLEEATTEAVEKYKAIQFIRAVKLAMNNTKMTYKQAQEINKILNLGMEEQKGHLKNYWYNTETQLTPLRKQKL